MKCFLLANGFLRFCVYSRINLRTVPVVSRCIDRIATVYIADILKIKGLFGVLFLFLYYGEGDQESDIY